MGFGRPVLVHDTPENREVAGDAALWWDARDPATLTRLLAPSCPDAARREALGASARRRAEERYRWDDVTTAYEALLGGVSPAGRATIGAGMLKQQARAVAASLYAADLASTLGGPRRGVPRQERGPSALLPGAADGALSVHRSTSSSSGRSSSSGPASSSSRAPTGAAGRRGSRTRRSSSARSSSAGRSS